MISKKTNNEFKYMPRSPEFQVYRDNLSKKLQEIRQSDPKDINGAHAKAQGYLEAQQETKEYKEARSEHLNEVAKKMENKINTKEDDDKSPILELQKLDLENTEGKLRLGSIIKNIPKLRSLRDKNGQQMFPFKNTHDSDPISRLQTLTSLDENGFEAEIDPDNILQDFTVISGISGHALYKMPFQLGPMFMGEDIDSFEEEPTVEDFVNKNKNNPTSFLTYLLGYSGLISTLPFMPTFSPTSHLLLDAERYYNHSLEPDKKLIKKLLENHPDYEKIKNLALQAREVQKLFVDVIYKILSSYIQKSDFDFDNATNTINGEDKELLLKTIFEFNTYYWSFMRDVQAINQLTEHRKKSLTIIKTGTIDENVEKECQTLSEFINLFRTALQKISSQINYYKR